jgi:hypothetical protein
MFQNIYPTKDTWQKISNVHRKCHYLHLQWMWHLNICSTFATYHLFINLVHRGQITCFVIFSEKLRNDYKYCHIFMGHHKPFCSHWSAHMHMVGNLSFLLYWVKEQFFVFGLLSITLMLCTRFYKQLFPLKIQRAYDICHSTVHQN